MAGSGGDDGRSNGAYSKTATEAPGEYVILDMRTGNKMVIKCDGPDVLAAG